MRPRLRWLATLSIALVGMKQPAHADLLWHWSLSGTGVSAVGTFTTGDAPDADGFFLITAIAGTANGAAITGLQPTGTAIPGNAGYPADNLIRATGLQLTGHGFGFSVSGGEYHNPFYQKDYRDYVSRPPYADGAGVEPTIQFTASPERKP